MKTFIYKKKILESDLDTFGHVNNAKYLQILEDSRWEFMTEGGYGLKEVHERRISPVITAIEIQYKKELKNREEVRIESQVKERIGEFRLVVEQKIYNEENKLSCMALTTVTTMDLDKRKIVLPPPDFLKSMGLE